MSGPYELYFAPLDTSIRFKVLEPDDASDFALDYEELPADDFRAKVLTSLIYDFRAKVIPMIAEDVDENSRRQILDGLYRSCVTLNPAVDIGEWNEIIYSNAAANANSVEVNKPKPKRTRRTKQASKKTTQKTHGNLETYLKDRVIGQEEAIASVVSSMKRVFAGLNDSNRPLGVYLFAGASGVGKTLLAEELHKYLFEGNYDMVRIDCGEYQHKHENQKLTGSPPGYTGHEDGGQLTNRIINNPESVVLLDEIEKAHPDVINTFLRAFDQGVLTDSQGRRAVFDKAIFILTTNLGNDEITKNMLSKGVGFGNVIHKNLQDADMPERQSVIQRTTQAVRDHFKPEVLNRIDDVIVFNHLTSEDFRQITEIELNKVAEKVSAKGYRLVWSEDVTEQIMETAANPVFGARGIARLRRKKIEDPLADLLLDNNYPKGTTFQVVYEDGDFCVTTQKPIKKVNSGN